MSQMRLPMRTSGPRWVALRIVSVLLKVIAWIVAVGGLLTAIGLIIGSVSNTKIVTSIPPFNTLSGGIVVGISVAIATLAAAALYFLVLYASSELILLLIAIEQNTRQ